MPLGRFCDSGAIHTCLDLYLFIYLFIIPLETRDSNQTLLKSHNVHVTLQCRTIKATANSEISNICTALRGMQMRSSDEKLFCLSVRLSVKRVLCDKTEKRSVQILYHTKDHSLVFWQEEWLVGATIGLYNLKFWVNRPPYARLPIFSRYSLVAPQRQHLAKMFN